MFPIPIRNFRIFFYQRECERLGILLLQYIEELSTKVSNISKTLDVPKERFEISSFYLYYHFRKVDERIYYSLCLAVSYLLQNFSLFHDEQEKYLFIDFLQNMVNNEKRLKGCKFFEGFLRVYLFQGELNTPMLLPPIREYKGNFVINDFLAIMRRIYTVRSYKHENIFEIKIPRKHPLVQKRIRGYTDKGSESSESEKARRQSLPFTAEEELKELYKERERLSALRWVKSQIDYHQQNE